MDISIYGICVFHLPTEICACFSYFETSIRIEALTHCTEWSLFVVDYFIPKSDLIRNYANS